MNEQQLRQIIRLAVKQARNITNDTEALEVKYLYKEYDAQIGRDLTVGEYIQYNDKLYKVLQAHTAKSNWNPVDAPSLFTEILVDPTGETILEWKQPSSTNAYQIGDKVIFEGKTYECIISNNVWSPAAYPAGWRLLD